MRTRVAIWGLHIQLLREIEREWEGGEEGKSRGWRRFERHRGYTIYRLVSGSVAPDGNSRFDMAFELNSIEFCHFTVLLSAGKVVSIRDIRMKWRF